MKHIPTYALYGELTDQREWLHWETIPARSRLHGFHIDQHRHENLMQVLLLEAGTATANLDGEKTGLTPGDLVLVPAMVVHEYVFSPDVDGVVLTLFESDVRALGFRFDRGVVCAGQNGDWPLIGQLIEEVSQPGARHDVVLNALLSLLFVTIERRASVHSSASSRLDRARDLAAKFRELVEQDYRSVRTLGAYTERLGISHTHLNRICKSVLAVSAQDVINRRLASEARRYLLFTDLPVKVVAAELGFDDPAYFARFVRRHLGQAPQEVRNQALTG